MRRCLKPCLIFSGIFLFLAHSLCLMKEAGTTAVVKYGNADLYEYFLPCFTFARKSILEGTLPWWTPYQGVGSPFFAAIQLGLLYPLNWTILLFDVPTALLITQLLNISIGLVGMMLFLRHLELQWSAVALGTVLFGYSILRVSYHFANCGTFCWTPLLFLLTHLLIEKPSFAACVCLTAALAVSFLGGNIQYFYYLAVLLGLYSFFLVLTFESPHGLRRMFFTYGLFILAFLLMTGLVSVQMFPTLELVRNSIRDLSRQFPGGNPFDRAFSPLDFFDSLVGKTRIEHYVGSALLLICFAPGSRRQWRVTVLLLGMLSYAILFVISKQEPLFAIFGAIPFSDSFRFPTRMLINGLFLVPALSAIGLSSLWDRAPLEIWNSSRRRPNMYWSLAIILTLVVFYAVCRAANDNSTGFSYYPYVVLLCLLFSFALLYFGAGLSDKKKDAFCWLLTTVLALDVFAHVNTLLPIPFFTTSGTTKVFDEQLEWVQDRAGYGRVLLIPDGFGSYNPNVGTMFNFLNINSYETFTLARWRNYLQYMMDSTELEKGSSTFNGVLKRPHAEFIVRKADVIGMTSLRYLVLPESRPGEIISELIGKDHSAWKLIHRNGDSNSKILVYENALALPHAYLVNSYEITHGENESLLKIRENASKLSSFVVLEDAAPSFPSSSPPIATGEIDISSYGINEVRLKARADGPCLAVLTDSYYPGWTAFVDGVETPIWRANSLFRAVEIPSGMHTVVFQYGPHGLGWGITVSGITVLCIVSGLCIERRYKKRSTEDREDMPGKGISGPC